MDLIDLFSQQLKKSEIAAAAQVESDADAEEIERANAEASLSVKSMSPDLAVSTTIDPADEVEEVSRSLQEVTHKRPAGRLSSAKFVNNVTQSDSTRLSVLIERFVESSKLDGKYFLCDHAQLTLVSNWLHSVPLTLAERYEYVHISAVTSIGRLYYTLHAVRPPTPCNG